MTHIWLLLQRATFVSSLVSFTFFWLPSLVRANILSVAWASASQPLAQAL